MVLLWESNKMQHLGYGNSIGKGMCVWEKGEFVSRICTRSVLIRGSVGLMQELI